MNFCKNCRFFYYDYKSDSNKCRHPDYSVSSLDLVTGEDDTDYKPCTFIRYKYYGSSVEDCPNFEENKK